MPSEDFLKEHQYFIRFTNWLLPAASHKASFMKLARPFLLFFVLFSLATSVQAQLTLSDTLSKTEQLQTLFGEGVFISNLNYQFCDTTNAMREFDATNTNLALGRGVLLSTGEADDAQNPLGVAACTVIGSTNLGMPGYTPLNALLPPGFSTNDACRISFDITPLCDSIAIKYVFASEEYPQYVNSNFNDVFAFYISGPGYPGTPGTNISLIPGTTTPVTINNINNGQAATCTPPTGPCTNCGYYINNTQGTTVGYNAWTKPLLAQATVVPCSTYTITIAIADAGDFILDSGVFLEAGGIGCTSPALQLATSNTNVLGSNIAVEGCVNTGQITFSLPQPLPDTTVFRYQISGTATPGIDYIPIPDSIVMPAGQTSLTLPIYIIDDLINEGSEFIQIYYVDSALCGTYVYQDTAFLEILDKPLLPDVEDISLCPGQTVQVPQTGVTSPGMTFQWFPGGGLSSTTLSSPFVTLPNASTTTYTKQYILTTEDLQGYCIFKDTITATVFPAVTADYVVDTVCFGVNTTFQDLSVTDSIVSYTWTLGDGTNSAQADPIHLYTQPGIYSSQLVVENTAGCKDSIAYDVLVNSLPELIVNAAPACNGSPVFIQNTVQPGTSYFWDFGDGTTSDEASPTHIYPTFGTYVISVIATTAAGCQDSTSLEVQIYENPVSSFTFEEACDGEPILFSQEITAGTGQAITYDWQFGDANTGSLPDPSHLYGIYGVKQVRLTIRDEFGCTDDSVQSVEVFPLPVADFVSDESCEFARYEFVNLSSVPSDKKITDYRWDLGDDGEVNTFPTPNNIYREEGTYTISLNIETENGCKDSITRTLDVYPVADVRFSIQEACVFDEAGVINKSSIPNPIFNDEIQEVIWDWGDGSMTVNEDTSFHTYLQHGQYDITLTTITDKGCERSFTNDINVFPLPADPVIVPDTACFGDPAFLMAMAPSDVIVNWYYREDDPSPFQQSYSYVTPLNTYYSTYYVEPVSDFGCIGNRIPIQVDIFDSESGRIQASATVVEVPSAIVTFSLAGSLTGVTYTWKFGDGETSDADQPVHEYQYPGLYEVELVVIDLNGCEYTFRELIEVKELIAIHVPSAFSPNGDGFNDELYLGWSLVHDLEFKLFNRWGQVVFETRDPDFNWNGIDKSGAIVAEGVYVFHVKAIDIQGRPIEKSGTITILR